MSHSDDVQTILNVVVDNAKKQIHSNVITPQIKIGPLAADIIRAATEIVVPEIDEDSMTGTLKKFAQQDNLIRNQFLNLAQKLDNIQ